MTKLGLILIVGALAQPSACSAKTDLNGVQGQWELQGGQSRLVTATPEWALATSDALQGDLTVEGSVSWGTADPAARAGLIFAYKDPKNFAVCALTKSGYKAWNATSTVDLYTLSFFQTMDGKEDLTNVCPWGNSKNGTYRLKVTVAGKQVLATLDGKPVMQGNIYPALLGGKAGIAAQSIGAEFHDVTITATPTNTHTYGVNSVPHDASGAVLPRWPHKEMITRPTEFVLWAADNATGNNVTDEQGKTWPGYVYACTIFLNGTIGNPTNYPPQEFSFFNNGFLDYYQFTGDERALNRAKQLAAWVMTPAHMIPAPWKASGLSVTKTVVGKVRGDGDGKSMGLPMEGKITEDIGQRLISLEEQGAVAITILRLYHLTGYKSYLRYCTGVANALLRFQLSEGNWHYRINALTGEPNNDWTANVVDNLIFMDEMAAATGNKAYSASARRAEKWLIDEPCKTNRWLGIFGDVPSNVDPSWANYKGPDKENMSGFVTMGAGRHILSMRKQHPELVKTAEGLRQWIVDKFVRKDSNGELAVAEQSVCFCVMPYHGFHESMLECDLYEATRKEEYKKAALHYLNAGMYQTELSGFIHLLGGGLNQGGLDTWWCNILWAPTAYLYAMGTFPELAPKNENHLLRVESPLTSIEYPLGGVHYGTSRAGMDRLVVRAKPKSVKCNFRSLPEVKSMGAKMGWVYDASSHLLKINHPKGTVDVRIRS